MSRIVITVSRMIFFRLLAHAPEELQQKAKEDACRAIPAFCLTEGDIREKFAQEEQWEELSEDNRVPSVGQRALEKKGELSVSGLDHGFSAVKSASQKRTIVDCSLFPDFFLSKRRGPAASVSPLGWAVYCGGDGRKRAK